MASALEAHSRPPSPQPVLKATRAEDFSAAKRHRGCIHCHNINEFRRADEIKAGTWDRESVWVYPLPENIGITLDRDRGNIVEKVATNSVSEQARIKPGDRILKLNGQPVASFADASFALHHAPKVGSIPIVWEQDGTVRTAKLNLAAGWRKTNLTWRPSMLDLLPSVPFAGDDLIPAEKRQFGLAPDLAAFRQTGRVHSTLAASGIRLHDVIIGVDEQQIKGEIGDFLGYVRRNYLVGDTVSFTVIRDGKRVTIRHQLK